MRRLLLLVVLIALSSLTVNAQCVKVNGWSQLGGQSIVTSGITSTTKAQKSFPSSTVTIYDQGTTNLRALFTNSGCTTPKANPFTASATDASYSFYVLPGRLDFRFSGTGITVPFTISDISVGGSDLGIFNVQAYGWIPDGTDRSAAALALLAAVYAAGGGTIYFPASTGNYRADSQLFIPNDGASPQPNQPNIKFEGAGGGHYWWFGGWGRPASVLDLRYHASDGNAKIESRGTGTLKIENLGLMDGSSPNATPFIHVTNTTPVIRDSSFKGTGVWVPGGVGSTATTQDAIVLGGATSNIDGSLTATYQGYCALIEGNGFTELNRGVYLRWNANCAVIKDNTWLGNTGTRAIESSGVVGDPNLLTSGLTITGNTIEMDIYLYGIVLTNTIGSRLDNSFYDPGNGYLASYLLTGSPGNTIIRGAAPGYGSDVIAGDSASLATTNAIGGVAPPAIGTLGGQQDVFLFGNTNAEFGNNLVVRGSYNAAYRGTYPGQLALADAVSPGYVLRLGYAKSGSNDFAFVDSLHSGFEGRPLLLNPGEAINPAAATGLVGVGRMPATALAAPLHVGIDNDDNAQRWGSTTNSRYLHLTVSTGSTRFNSSGNRPFTFAANGIDGLSLDGTAAVTMPISLSVGGGTAITKIAKGTVTIDPASINATTVSSQTFTLSGAVAGDSLVLNPPAAGLTAGLLVSQVFVSSGGTVTIVFYNTTGAPIDEASASWTYTLIRS